MSKKEPQPPSKKYLRIHELTNGMILLPDILSAFAAGTVRAFSEKGAVKFISCPADFLEWSESATFNKWGQWEPDEAERAEHEESMKWEAFLSKMWGRTVRLSKRIIPKIGELPSNPNFFPMPLDEASAHNMGLEIDVYNNMLMSLLIATDEIKTLDRKIALAREEVSDLKIILGLMLELKIDPDGRNATANIKGRLNRQGIELDDETIRDRVKKIRSKFKDLMKEI